MRVIVLSLESRTWLNYLMIKRRSTKLLIIASAILVMSASDKLTFVNIPMLKSLAGVFGLILAVAWLITNGRQLKISRGPQSWLIVVICVLLGLTIFQTVLGAEVRFGNFLQWFQPLVFAVILFDLTRDPRAYKIFGIVFLSVSFSIAVLGLLGLSSGNYGDRLGFEGLNLNAQSYYYGISWLTLAAFLLDRWPRVSLSSVMLLGAMLVLIYAQIATGSRGGILSAFVGFCVLLALFLRARNVSAYISIVPVVVVSILLMVLTLDTFLERIQATVAGDDYGTRDLLWSAALELIEERPITGNGPAFMNLLGPMLGKDRYSTHNTLLQVLVAYGLIGFTVFFAFFWGILRRCWKHRKSNFPALFLVLLSTSLMFGMTGDLMFDRYFWVLVAMSANVVPLCRAGLSLETIMRLRTSTISIAGRKQRVLTVRQVDGTRAVVPYATGSVD